MGNVFYILMGVNLVSFVVVIYLALKGLNKKLNEDLKKKRLG